MVGIVPYATIWSGIKENEMARCFEHTFVMQRPIYFQDALRLVPLAIALYVLSISIPAYAQQDRWKNLQERPQANVWQEHGDLPAAFPLSEILTLFSTAQPLFPGLCFSVIFPVYFDANFFSRTNLF